MIKFGLPLVPSRIGLMLGFVSNRFFLRWLGSPDPTMALAQIGLFSLGHKFGVIINRFVTVPFNSFWSPRRMELLLGEEAEAQKTIARVCTYATLGSIFVGLIISSGIENLIEIMAAPGYKGAYLIVPFVALSYIALGLDTHFATGIFYGKKTQWSTYITLLSLGVVLLWNYIFVPRYGLIGAATSNLAGFVVRISLTYSISQRILYIPFEIKRLGKMMGLALVLYFISQGIAFESPYLTFMARTGIASTFPLLLFFTRFYTTGELEFIRKIIRKIFRANET
jgi:O-antigen/teichoic acid export membrane protein